MRSSFISFSGAFPNGAGGRPEGAAVALPVAQVLWEACACEGREPWGVLARRQAPHWILLVGIGAAPVVHPSYRVLLTYCFGGVRSVGNSSGRDSVSFGSSCPFCRPTRSSRGWISPTSATCISRLAGSSSPSGRGREGPRRPGFGNGNGGPADSVSAS